MKNKDLRDFLALCKVTLTQDGTPPDWIELIPPGNVGAVDGRKFKNTNPQVVVDAFNAVDLDLPIDWEHSTEIKAPVGEPAPAAGWIQALEVRDGSIWGRVEWTGLGAASLASKEYRYISPAFKHDKNGEVLKLVSAGLTNKPALDQLAAVARADSNTPGLIIMDPKILLALSLSSTASADEVIATIIAMRSGGEKMAQDLTTLRSELSTAGEALAIATAKVPPLDLFVPRADHDALKLRAETAEASIVEAAKTVREKDVADEITAALKAGKITPATEEYYKAACAAEGGLQLFRDFVKSAPVIAKASGLDGERTPEGGAVVTDSQLAIATQCGLSAEDFKVHMKTVAAF